MRSRSSGSPDPSRSRSSSPVWSEAARPARPTGRSSSSSGPRNFILTSSLSPDATIEFALQLELFYAGVRALLGLSDDPDPTLPTPVYVFDDRSFGRPFAVQNEAAYLLDEVEAPILVFRGGRDFAARATPDLRHRFAHRVLRDHAREERPLWYEEGVAQLARTLDETSKGVVVGRLAPEFQQSVLDWRRGDLLASLQRSDLSDATPPERLRFEAQTWAIAHTLEFEDRPAAGSSTPLTAYRSALDARDAATRDGAFAALGVSPKALEKRIYEHLEQRRPKVRLLEIRGLQMSRWKPVSLSPSESRSRLGELALRLERPELALEYFERALDSDPQHAAARIGRAVAAARLGQSEVVDSTFATIAAPVRIQRVRSAVAAGDAYRAVAEGSDSPETPARGARRLHARDMPKPWRARSPRSAPPSAWRSRISVSKARIPPRRSSGWRACARCGRAPSPSSSGSRGRRPRAATRDSRGSGRATSCPAHTIARSKTRRAP